MAIPVAKFIASRFVSRQMRRWPSTTRFSQILWPIRRGLTPLRLTTFYTGYNSGADFYTRGFMKYQCISADSHLEIRPDRYVKRVPEKFRDRAPKVITLEDGSLAVLQEGQPLERLVGIGVIPITNIEDAVAELEHCAKSGLNAVAIDNFPAGNRYPTAGDDRFWSAVVDLNVALTIHVEFGFPRRGRGQPAAAGPSFKYPRQTDPEHHVPDVIERFNKYGFRGSKQVVQMIWGGVFERFPKINIYVAEVQIGWVPNWMDQMDNEYGRQQYWAERVLGLPRLRRLPSEYAREHCHWGFNRNPAGVRIARQEMGVDRVMWASDFPHLESDWPNS